MQVGTLMAGTDKFLIRVTGVSGHGGTPHLVKDSVLAGAAVVMNLQPLISRETDPAQGGIVGVTLINSGMYPALVTLCRHMLKLSLTYLQCASKKHLLMFMVSRCKDCMLLFTRYKRFNK